MTSHDLEVNASFVDMAHESNEDDISFFSFLPNARIRTYDLETGRPARLFLALEIMSGRLLWLCSLLRFWLRQ
jgi:hypothetical protein